MCHRADAIDGALGLIVDIAWRVKYEAAVGEPNDGHAGINVHASKVDRVLVEPNLVRDIFDEHLLQATSSPQLQMNCLLARAVECD